MGHLHNAWGLYEKAKTHLEKAYELEPSSTRYAVELSFSYNCLKEHESAANILKNVLVLQPRDAYANKEYVYALLMNKDVDKAAKQLENFELLKVKDNYKTENYYNLLYSYFLLKDKENFDKTLNIFNTIDDVEKSPQYKYAQQIVAKFNE